MLSAVETVQKLLLHLPPTVDGLKLQVGIPVKGDTFQHLDDLLHHQIIVHASTVVCLDKMCNMLFWIALSIELQEFWRWIATGHAQCINPLGVRLGVKVSFAHFSSKLYLNCICSQVLDLLAGHQAWRPVVLELTAFLWVHLLVRSFALADALSSFLLSELFTKDRSDRFSCFLASLVIFSSHSLMHASFSSFPLTSISSLAFMVAIPSSQLFVPIIMTFMTTALEDSASISG